jgi:hypothetical protein
MAADWKIEIEAERGLIRWQLYGFFHISDIEAFHQQSVAAVGHLGLKRG